MSTGNDNPFARWSRRKLAVRQAEAPTPDEAALPAGAAGDDAEDDDLQSAPAEPDTAEPPEPLPRLEDLTAASDLTAFLRKGVPGALRNTALRKMWSLDPVIRDYVGPAEYAWDFNKPGSMPGFGPLEAGKAVANFLSTLSNPDPQDTVVEPQSARREETIALPDQDAVAPSDRPEEAAASAEPARHANWPNPPHSDLPQSREADAAAAPGGKRAPSESPRIPASSRHGSALPR